MKNVEKMNKENEQVQANTEMAAEDVETNEGVKRREKIILITVGIILFLLLIGLLIFCVNGFMRNGLDARGGNDSAVTTTGMTCGKDQNGGTDGTTPTGNGTQLPIVTLGNNDDHSNPVVPPAGDNGNGGVSTKPNLGKNDNDNDNSGKNVNTGSNNTVSKPTEPSGKPDNGGPDSKPSGGNDKDKDVPAYTGEVQVKISEVNVGTSIITVTADGEQITVPVQTTVFNGRVTKSGVARGKLFGYNSGATIMLFYPEADGFTSHQINGYMSRTNDGLTILVDINGSGSKLLIKINGMKALS